MIQLQAGYFINAIIERFVKNKNNTKIQQLLHHLSHFNLHTNTDLTIKNREPAVAVINNLISRGLPTYPTTFIENRIANTFVKTKKITNGNTFAYKFINDELDEEIHRALHIIDPRFSIDEINKNLFDNNNKQKEKFIKEFLPLNIGNYFVQLLEKDRTLENIIKNTKNNNGKTTNIIDEKYKNEQFDYTLETPCQIAEKAGITIKFIDENTKIDIDFVELEKKHKNLSKLNWCDHVIISGNNNEDKNEYQKIIDFTFNDYFDIIRKNYTSPLYNNQYGLDALQIALTPLATVRIEKTILKYILAGKLQLNAEKWTIGIIERDIPAAFLAIEDLTQLFDNIYKLEGLNKKLPKINLTIYYTPEFENAQFNILYQGKIMPIEDFDPNIKFDLLIDTSILRRNNFDFPEIKHSAKHFAKIRSTTHLQKKRKFIFAKKIKYNSYFFDTTNKTFKQKEQENITKNSLNYFFKNIFRHDRLSYLQLKILHNLLSNENSLAVVSANEQKEILYKFLTLLQPGISLIITPLMSGLKYQFDDLLDNFIDTASYFSASTQKIHDKYLALNKLKNGISLFNYITPDRLHLPEFRQILKEAFNNNTFSYIVIDQAHCISEWSHDFRSLYATIYNNIEIITKNNKLPQFICFSETSSYDVIKDITYYFKIQTKNTVQVDLTIKNVNLKFTPVQIQETEQIEKITEKLSNAKIKKVKDKLSNSRNIIICRNPREITEKVNTNGLKSLSFEGTIGDKFRTISTLKSRQAYKNYEKYINSKVNTLISTYSLTISCDLPAKNLYFDVPVSTELFIQTLGKMYASDKINVEVLCGNQNIKMPQTQCEFDNEGQLIEKKQTIQISTENIARNIMFKRINVNLKKEFQIINEIMNSITYPNERIADILIRRIHYSFEIWIQLENQPTKNPTKLYIHSENNDPIGYIDFEKNQIINQAATTKIETSQQILEFVKYDIEKIVAEGIEIFNIINDKIKLTSKDGISSIWANMKKNENATITIEFYNNAISTFNNTISKNENINLNQNQIIDIYEKALDINEFLKLFNKIIDPEKKILPKYKNEIQKLYENFRNYFDTLPAIYRLFSIGIIEDYIIDFQNQQFTLVIKKKSNTEIINKIFKKIKPFVAKNQALKVYEKIPKTKGNSILTKAINYYHQFVYFKIFKKRKDSYNNIYKHITNSIGNEKQIFPYLNNYFTAKYILELKEDIKQPDFTAIEKYFNNQYLLKDDLMHLRRSSELILNINNNNHNALIINGLAGIILYSEKDNNRLKKAITKLAKGISIYRDKNTNITEKIHWLINIIKKYDIDAKSKIENLLFLKIHANWLNDLNKKLQNINNQQ